METGRLIEALAADAGHKPAPMSRVWAAGLILAVAVAAGVFFATLGPRDDIAAAAGTVRFLFKFVVTLALFGTAFAALAALARPGADGSRLSLLVLAPALLAGAVVLELLAVPGEQVGMLWQGKNAAVCLTYIPLIGLGPLAAFLVGLRHGAPTRPALAGAVAGVVAGGLAATFYAAHCIDDSPLFVATWYTLAIAILAALGALGGKLFARW
jgi:hypothetical protein